MADPDQPGARDGASRAQRLSAALLLASAALVSLFAERPAAWLGVAMAPVFLSIIVVQLAATFEKLPSEPLELGEPSLWPRYSVLVPLYHEARVVRDLEAALSTMDYPADRLEIMLLLEADDIGTLEALQAIALPSFYHIVIVPPGEPRTKPRALNHGLALATGEFVTVFDAEDVPDADQLKKAVLAFGRHGPNTMCLQAHLVIDNGDNGWLPRMMSIEYAALFDVLKCGLTMEGLPIPLGGTSNHFRRKDLIRLAGWDAWNVTEDADLGLRIARAGGKIADLNSATYEEAPIGFRNWLGQRRRWLKGWTQTGICHARKPMAGIRGMGLWAWIFAMVQVLGMVIGALLYPFMVLWIVWNCWTGDILETTTWLLLAANSLALEVLLVGSLALVLPAVLGLKRRGMLSKIAWLVTMPMYLLLISLAAWLAMIDVVKRPFHWEKTQHGLGKRQAFVLRNRPGWRS
jgi:glycosyltransferase XagB